MGGSKNSYALIDGRWLLWLIACDSQRYDDRTSCNDLEMKRLANVWFEKSNHCVEEQNQKQITLEVASKLLLVGLVAGIAEERTVEAVELRNHEKWRWTWQM